MRKITTRRPFRASYALLSTVTVMAAVICILFTVAAFAEVLGGHPVPALLSAIAHGSAQVSVFAAAGAVLAERWTR